jgi:hypothetical protein
LMPASTGVWALTQDAIMAAAASSASLLLNMGVAFVKVNLICPVRAPSGAV